VSALRVYCDEDSQNHALVDALRSRGVEVTTAGEAGLLGQSDEAQLLCAHEQSRVLFTHNAGDFCRLHDQFLGEGRPHAGIVVAEQGFSVGERLRRLLKLADMRTAEDMRGQIEFLSNWT
jgi:hypothetical protein